MNIQFVWGRFLGATAGIAGGERKRRRSNDGPDA
jgi:hypothetical protein